MKRIEAILKEKLNIQIELDRVDDWNLMRWKYIFDEKIDDFDDCSLLSWTSLLWLVFWKIFGWSELSLAWILRIIYSLKESRKNLEVMLTIWRNLGGFVGKLWAFKRGIRTMLNISLTTSIIKSLCRYCDKSRKKMPAFKNIKHHKPKIKCQTEV